VVYTAIDNSGNADSCSFDVSVSGTDTEDPVISSCPNNIETCSPVTAWVPPTTSDNCGVQSFTRDLEITTTFTQEITTVTYTAIDLSGNSDSCTFAVTQHPLPTADAGLDTSILLGDSVEIGGSPTGLGGTSSYQYFWSPTSTLDNGTSSNPVASPVVTTSYIVFVIDSIGCAGTDEVKITVVPAIENEVTDKHENETPGLEVKLYPNPTSDWLTIEVPVWKEPKEVELEVRDLLGRKVYGSEGTFSQISNLPIDVGGWVSGQYLVRVIVDDQIITKQIGVVK
jgi:hypothetical protein